MADSLFHTGNYYSNVLDADNGSVVSYVQTTTWYDGSTMTDAKCDGDIYKKLSVSEGSGYVRYAFDPDKPVPLYVESVADLRALSKKTLLLIRLGYYNAVVTKGYYNDQDGGASEYEIVPNTTSADNGFTVIRPTNVDVHDFYFRPIIKGSINVKIAGAKGDGVTDDRAAIQMCIDYAVSANNPVKQGTVYLPQTKASYLIASTHPSTYTTSGLVISAPMNLVGDGASVISAGATMEQLILFPVAMLFFKARGIVLKASTSGTSNATYCVYVSDYVANSYFENIRFEDAKFDGIFINTWVTTFLHCRAGNNGRYGFHIGTATTSTSFINCYALDNGSMAEQDHAGYLVEKAGYSSFISCASDRTGTGYRLKDVDAVGMYSCGAEGVMRCVNTLGTSTGLTIDNFRLFSESPYKADYWFEIYNATATIKGFSYVDGSQPNHPNIAVLGLTNAAASVICLDGSISYDSVSGTGSFFDVSRTALVGPSGGQPTTNLRNGMMYYNTTTGRPQFWNASASSWREASTSATTTSKGVVYQAAASADTAAAVGSTYNQAQVQGILLELRDLKSKLRTATVLAP